MAAAGATSTTGSGHRTAAPQIIAAVAAGSSTSCLDVRVDLRVAVARIKRSDWERIERLSSLWDQIRSEVAGGAVSVDTVDSEVARNPKRQARTPLTDAEVEAIWAAREGGEGVIAIAERFGVSRMTVWEKTRVK